MKQHHYKAKIQWTGNLGQGTQTYSAYSRAHTIHIEGKYADLLASSDPSFRGDSSKYNPEELFLSSLSACHMLWYLHLCTVHKIEVVAYSDDASGTMEEAKNGSGRFTAVTLHPEVEIADADKVEKAKQLHEEANQMCFIANSCNFVIAHKPSIKVVTNS
ncbi:MAG: OsmC family protein [Bacteroidota bacterium]